MDTWCPEGILNIHPSASMFMRGSVLGVFHCLAFITVKVGLQPEMNDSNEQTWPEM